MQSPEEAKLFARKRRSLLLIGCLALAYPVLRFIHFAVPRKPKRIDVNKQAPASGVLSTTDFILFDREGKTWAVTRRCTHLGCKLNYHEQDNYLECPCHQSRFSIEGDVMRGPAKESLAVYEVEKNNTAPFYTIIS